MKRLEYICVTNCDTLCDISAIKYCENIQNIDFMKCPLITDISSLDNCTKLDIVYFDTCVGISKENADALKLKLPNTCIQCNSNV